ncbi:peroxide stress protein YaaA [Cyclobacterium sp. 1_MG-2023]|uniref:peroxide stress protein YaaA n=1 Tax=Cyclobacterium sp. 1_MG-2023 TaxID=3062681 RepID=UPI0026E32CD5|nr:peroxide stress protein YaaA [Cyclobacterium sp. 1_MG-2023]MDO6438205.1 peroxide stress protein YaaA [Cyclobacterium sp. 1_MG-2023]
MIVLISPAKTLDYSPTAISIKSQPEFKKEIAELVSIMKKKSGKAIQDLMGVSENLADLNVERYKQFSDVFNEENAKQALLAFKGDVYTHIDVESFSAEDFSFAQEHLRILSGLYGLLRPMDMIQPYRLEMGIKLKNKRGKNLYEFWGDKITKALNEIADEKPVINLASKEYFKAVKKKALKSPLVSPVFKEYKNGSYKNIGIFSKQARGLMTDFIIKNKVENPEMLKTFNEGNYEYSESKSSSDEWVFIR